MLRKGRYQARLAETADDIAAAQRLRYRAFIAATGAAPRADGREADPFDAICTHILVEEPRSGRLVCCLRLLPLKQARTPRRKCWRTPSSTSARTVPT